MICYSDEINSLDLLDMLLNQTREVLRKTCKEAGVKRGHDKLNTARNIVEAIRNRTVKLKIDLVKVA